MYLRINSKHCVINEESLMKDHGVGSGSRDPQEPCPLIIRKMQCAMHTMLMTYGTNLSLIKILMLVS